MTDFNLNEKMGWDHCPDSNAEKYIQACRRFVSSESEFEKFRQDKDYGKILEGGEYEVGVAYLERIKRVHDISFLNQHIQKFKENDLYGSPTIHSFDLFGNICPNTIHYVCSVLDIHKFFSGIEFKKVVEIGAGFGALCKIFSSVYNFDEYIIVDLPDVVNLCQKYLSKFPELSDRVKFVPCDTIDDFDFSSTDLCISEAAMAECGYETQKMYIDKIVNQSARTYITYNTLHISNAQDIFSYLISNTKHTNIHKELNPMNSEIVYKW